MAKIRPNEDRGKRASVWILIMTALSVLTALSAWYTYTVYDSLASGRFSYNELMTLGVVVGLLGFVQIVLYILTMVFFIQWFRRAYYNLHQLTSGLTYSEGWAAGAWFVPIFSWIGPIQIARELFKKSTQLLGDQAKGIDDSKNNTTLSIWWTLWVVSAVLGTVSSAVSRNETDLDGQKLGAIFSSFSAFLAIGAGIFCYRVIKNYMVIEKQLEQLEVASVEYKVDQTDLLDSNI